MNKILNFIGGKLVPPVNDSFLENINPATGQCYSFVPDSDEADVAAAVLAAEKHFQLGRKHQLLFDQNF